MHAQLHNAGFLRGEPQSVFHKYSHSLAEELQACGTGGGVVQKWFPGFPLGAVA